MGPEQLWTQTYYAVLTREETIVRWSANGPPILYETQEKAAKSCEQGQRVTAVRVAWKARLPD